MQADFPNAQPPALRPLTASFVENDVEADLQQLVLDIFQRDMSADVFDANVLGAAHLGSFDLVRRAVTADGLILIPGDPQAPATRYLYRAWRAANAQGRGLHFLRTYLQLLFPGSHTLAQMLQHKGSPYPTGLTPWDGGEIPSDKYLTSRLEITVDADVAGLSVAEFASFAQSVVPARFVVHFRVITSGGIGTGSVAAFSGTSVLHSSGALLD